MLSRWPADCRIALMNFILVAATPGRVFIDYIGLSFSLADRAVSGVPFHYEASDQAY
jgi:hypothetical protein